MTIDSHYYLGCGNRGGCEREVVYWVDDSTEPIVFRDDVTIKVDGGGVAFTLGARDFKGVQCVSYQTRTGSIMANSHPGSYCGQDAYNDMFVTENSNGLVHRKRTSSSALLERKGWSVELYDGSAENFEGGGIT